MEEVARLLLFLRSGRRECGAFCGAEDDCGANGCMVAGDPQMRFELWKSRSELSENPRDITYHFDKLQDER